MQNETKAWWQSKTIIGAGVTLVSSVLHMTGLPISDADTSSLVDGIVSILGTLGGLYAIYGRVAATKSLN